MAATFAACCAIPSTWMVASRVCWPMRSCQGEKYRLVIYRLYYFHYKNNLQGACQTSWANQPQIDQDWRPGSRRRKRRSCWSSFLEMVMELRNNPTDVDTLAGLLTEWCLALVESFSFIQASRLVVKERMRLPQGNLFGQKVPYHKIINSPHDSFQNQNVSFFG